MDQVLERFLFIPGACGFPDLPGSGSGDEVINTVGAAEEGCHGDLRDSNVLAILLAIANTSRPKSGENKWTGAESNRRHTAFQAVALPTELPVRKFPNLTSERSERS